MESIIANLDTFIITLLAVIGGLRLVADGLEKIAQVTPTTRDDAAVAKFKKGLTTVTNILRRIGLEPKKDA